ncbi:hypothetical protein AB0L30_11045 [Microbispora rosea]|uniref:hypothetical protein n=1 Tax=Microbispora rosea TaxID=58117 RepID=UPI003428D111
MNAALLAGLAEAISDREVVRFDLPADAALAYLGQGLNADRRRVRLVVRARPDQVADALKFEDRRSRESAAGRPRGAAGGVAEKVSEPWRSPCGWLS